MTVLYPYLCYNEACYKGNALYIHNHCLEPEANPWVGLLILSINDTYFSLFFIKINNLNLRVSTEKQISLETKMRENKSKVGSNMETCPS